jgi:hypothetical protein
MKQTMLPFSRAEGMIYTPCSSLLTVLNAFRLSQPLKINRNFNINEDKQQL